MMRWRRTTQAATLPPMPASIQTSDDRMLAGFGVLLPLLTCPHATLTSWPQRPQNRAFSRDGAFIGLIDMRAQAEVRSARRSDTPRAM